MMIRWSSVGLVVLVLIGWIGLGRPASAAEAVAPEVEASQPLRSAQRTQQVTRSTLRVLSSGTRCAESRFVSYRRSDREPEVVDQWYVVSQLWADAMLLGSDHERLRARPDVRLALRQARAPEWDERDARCHVDKGFVFLDRLWDDEEGGYYPRSNPNGSKITRNEQYADDNALAGLALLAAADSADGSFSRDYYLYAAVLEAEYLQESGLWDDTFGGGFWWSTGMGDTDEGKPAQTNALAALFFARLYGVTGDPAHRDAALSTIGWLDAALFDAERNLYRWSVRYERPAEKVGGPVRSERFFNYDQGLAIEAQLAVAKLDGNQDRVARARAIGDAMHTAFWSRERAGYNLEAGVEQVYTSYAAWTSLGHLALYAQDGDQRWLQMAQANARAITANAAEPDGGYALRYYACVDGRAPGCGGGRTRWAVDHTRDTAAQAWAQHLQTALARSITLRR
jgi:Glycosyl hydrolase family 76